ncbi:hypothetical protein AJ79_10317 [Helicocarpus griseus UAMH5409]|uniref:Uncharacterized protein n=1 Tax=Helicocarpus griseus UAMH5409 TaxID=1447875 RepID=A0A2B7WEK3_9EURO|nr:hypothetical protein AJ79_10317 [Helicocarpus griseus UAMH5409]
MVSDFFSRFAGFKPNPSVSAKDEFARLAHNRNWKENGGKYQKEWAKFIAWEFSKHYGPQVTKLENWQSLCHEVGIEDGIESITKCKKALRSVHVNIVDLVDARRTGKKVKTFRSEAALRNYTLRTERIFPKKAAKGDGFLKALLREIF